MVTMLRDSRTPAVRIRATERRPWPHGPWTLDPKEELTDHAARCIGRPDRILIVCKSELVDADDPTPDRPAIPHVEIAEDGACTQHGRFFFDGADAAIQARFRVGHRTLAIAIPDAMRVHNLYHHHPAAHAAGEALLLFLSNFGCDIQIKDGGSVVFSELARKVWFQEHRYPSRKPPRSAREKPKQRKGVSAEERDEAAQLPDQKPE